MSPRRLLLLGLLLAACPPRPALERPPAPSTPAGQATTPTASTPPDEPAAPPPRDDPGGPDGPDSSMPETRPHGDDELADTLAPRGLREPPAARRPATTDCEGGSRRLGDTWSVDCNRCTCGDDGQSTCTTLACGPNPR